MKKVSEFVGEILFKLNYLKFITKLLFLNKKAFKVYFFYYLVTFFQTFIDLIMDNIFEPIGESLSYVFSERIAAVIALFFVIPFLIPLLIFHLIAKILRKFVDRKKVDDFFENEKELISKARYEYDVQVSKIRKKYFSTTFDGDENE